MFRHFARMIMIALFALVMAVSSLPALAHEAPVPTPSGGPWRGSVIKDVDVTNYRAFSPVWDDELLVSNIVETCHGSGHFSASTAGQGETNTEWFWDLSGYSRHYVMPTVFNYTLEQTCTADYDYIGPDTDTDDDRACSYSVTVKADVHDYTSVDGISISYHDLEDGGYTWLMTTTFRPGKDHLITSFADSCGELRVYGRSIVQVGEAGGVDASEEDLISLPVPDELQSGVSSFSGYRAGCAGDDCYDQDSQSWSFTYYGPEVRAPGSPVIGTASSGKVGRPVNATARWGAPAADGGSALTAYRVQARKLNAAGAVVAVYNATRVPSARHLTMKLPKGRYMFRVAAVNAKGESPWSAGSNIVKAR